MAQSATELFAAIAERHGGEGVLSIVDLEVIAALVRLFSSIRMAEVSDLPRLVDSVAKLEAMLPQAPKSARSPLQALQDHIAATHGPPS